MTRRGRASPSDVAGTGVVISEYDAATHGAECLWRDPVERHAAEQRIARGQTLLVQCQVFADLLTAGGKERIAGTVWGFAEVSLQEDPSKTLIEHAYRGREHLGDLFGDVALTALSVGRWEFYAAPFRVELQPGVALRLLPLMDATEDG